MSEKQIPIMRLIGTVVMMIASAMFGIAQYTEAFEVIRLKGIVKSVHISYIMACLLAIVTGILVFVSSRREEPFGKPLAVFAKLTIFLQLCAIVYCVCGFILMAAKGVSDWGGQISGWLLLWQTAINVTLLIWLRPAFR